MNINIHPLLVHFPIALLSVYAVAELLRIRSLMSRPWWFNFKATLVILGDIAVWATVISGGWAKNLVSRESSSYKVIELHSLMANTTAWIFTAIAVAYFFAVLERAGFFKRHMVWADAIARFCNWLVKSPIVVIAALVGLVTLTLTGTLGGIIVYGPDLDPATKFVYNMFFGAVQ